MLYVFSLLLLAIINYSEGTSSGALSEYIASPGKLLPGPLPQTSFKILRNVSLSACAASCSLSFKMNEFPCYSFEYSPVSYTCVHSNVTTLLLNGGYLGLKSNMIMQYYERPKGSYRNLFQELPNSVLQKQESYFATFKDISLEKCAFFCLLETRDTCMSYSYRADTKFCGLSNIFYADGNGQNLKQSSLYNHYQYYTTWPCNATIPWNYHPRAIASPYFPYASISDVNCYVRIEAPEGKQIDIQFSTFFTQSSLCTLPGAGLTVIDGFSSRDPVLAKMCNSDNFVMRRFQTTSGYLFIRFSTGKVAMAFKAVYDFVSADPCAEQPCQNGGHCTSTGGHYKCACPTGYTGTKCETDIDDCASKPCYFGGVCVDGINNFTCVCPKILGGRRCEKYTGICYTQPCQNGGQCTARGSKDYDCSCKEGFSGRNCTRIILPDPCDNNPCQNGGSCTSTGSGNYSCACASGYNGKNCENNIDDCASEPCMFNTPCEDLVDDFSCNCPKVLAGKTCSTFIGRCSENPCVHGKCSPLRATDYTCKCDNGYAGVNCTEETINFCKPSPCRQGKCESTIGGPSCSCRTGYTGFYCDTKLNKCVDVDCGNGECLESDNGYTCHCFPGYKGHHCNHTTNRCLEIDCGQGTCVNTLTGYYCACTKEFTGRNCEMKVAGDLCESSPCLNGTCIQTYDSFVCQCSQGHTGKLCESTINYCANSPCHYGSCESSSSGYICICEFGYTGKNCTETIDYCKPEPGPCVHGTCSNAPWGFECTCYSGFSGKICNVTATSCVQIKCVQGACAETKDGPICICQKGYTGHLCDTPVDNCMAAQCNYGLCENSPVGYSCICATGYHGEHCGVKDTESDIITTTESMADKISTTFQQPMTILTSMLDKTTNVTATTEAVTCSPSNCIHGVCSDSEPYNCQCLSGYEGEGCDVYRGCRADVKPCFHGNCSETAKGYRCTCEADFTGKQCEAKLDTSQPCDTNPCQNGGHCVILPDATYRCICHVQFTGDNCETFNLCSMDPCTKGVCIMTDDFSWYHCRLKTLVGHSNATVPPTPVPGIFQQERSGIEHIDDGMDYNRGSPNTLQHPVFNHTHFLSGFAPQDT